ARFVDLEAEQQALATETWRNRNPTQPGGLLKVVHGCEYPASNPHVVGALQTAVHSEKNALIKVYTALIDQRPASLLRSLLQLKEAERPLALDEVEPLDAILKRFDAAGISLGALSPEAHEAIAEAMNRIGGRSNSGEGGEDPARYGTARSSKI